MNALGFVFGFSLVFIALGALAGSLGRLLLEYAVIVNVVAGAVVIILGLNFLGIIKIGFLNRTSAREAPTKELTLPSAILFGVVFSVGWTPCVGAFLGSALLMASQQGSTLEGILMLLVYSLGLGVPFILSALLIEQLKGAFDIIKRNYRVITIVSGWLLVIVGILIATGLMGRALTFLSL